MNLCLTIQTFSQNYMLISCNCKLYTHNCKFTSCNSDFFPHNSEFKSRNFDFFRILFTSCISESFFFRHLWHLVIMTFFRILIVHFTILFFSEFVDIFHLAILNFQLRGCVRSLKKGLWDVKSLYWEKKLKLQDLNSEFREKEGSELWDVHTIWVYKLQWQDKSMKFW